MRVMEQVTDETSACARCANTSNFDPDTNNCVCTPDCGYCGAADRNFPLNLNRTGVACVDLGAVVEGKVAEVMIIPDTGGVMQGAGFEGGPECSYGFTHRNSKRGGKYDASVSDFPTSSIILVDMSTQTKHCSVDLLGSPARVVYVPRTPQAVIGVGPEVDATGTSTTSGTATTIGQATLLRTVGTLLLAVVTGVFTF